MIPMTIRTTDKAGIDGIIQTGRPAGYWMAQSEPFPRLWTGAVSDGHTAARKHGTFGEVLEWIQWKAGILRNAKADRLIRDCSDLFRGIRVTSEAAERIPEGEMERAKIYSGFSCSSVRGPARSSHMKTSAAAGGIRHGNTARPLDPRRNEVRERDEMILALCREGLLQKDIAVRLGVTPATINNRVRVMRKAGIDVPDVRRDKERAVRMERAEAFRRMRDEEGLNAPEISRRTGIHVQTVYSLLAIADGKEADG